MIRDAFYERKDAKSAKKNYFCSERIKIKLMIG